MFNGEIIFYFKSIGLKTCGLVVFIDMSIYILTEDGNFKTFLKENYEIVLDSCDLFTKL